MKSAVEIENGSSEYGANVQEWEVNGADCQNWILENAHNFGTEMDTNLIYTFSNANSGLIMDIKDGNMADGSNVQQWEANEFDCQKWKLVAYKDDNYYFIKSCMNEKYGLCMEEDGNLSIKTFDEKDKSMLFKFAKNIDNTYSIMTYLSEDKKILEVINAGTEIGDNIQQWDMNGNLCQKWNISTSEMPQIICDVNADEIFNIADLILLQKWLLAVPDTELANWKVADFTDDDFLNVFDLCLMKNSLIKQVSEQYAD